MARCALALTVLLFAGCSRQVPQTPTTSTEPVEDRVDDLAEQSTVDFDPAAMTTTDAASVLPATDSAVLPTEFLEGGPDQRARLDGLLANPTLPEFGLSDWRNSEPLDWSTLRGKVVVLDFWATWCGPCLGAIPHTNELADRHAGDVVFIALCAPNGAEKMDEVIEQRGIRYPVAVDTDSVWNEHFGVNGFPDYYIIGRNGELLGADVANGNVEAAIEYALGL